MAKTEHHLNCNLNVPQPFLFNLDYSTLNLLPFSQETKPQTVGIKIVPLTISFFYFKSFWNTSESVFLLRYYLCKLGSLACFLWFHTFKYTSIPHGFKVLHGIIFLVEVSIGVLPGITYEKLKVLRKRTRLNFQNFTDLGIFYIAIYTWMEVKAYL